MNESYHKWHKTEHASLFFDIVSLRDIEEDEEILIDYGEEWEREHVATFDAPRRGYILTYELNQQADLQTKTVHERDHEGVDGIYTFCRGTTVKFRARERERTWRHN